MSYKQFVKLFLCFFILFNCLIIVINFVVDPLQFYRKASFYEPVFLKEQRYQNPGLAKNYFFDLAIFGSSTSEDLSLEKISNKFKSRPLKFVISAPKIKEEYLIANIVLNKAETKNIIWGVDYFVIGGDSITAEQESKVMPYYLYDEKSLNDIFYLLSYRTLLDSTNSLRGKGEKDPANLVINRNYKGVTGKDVVLKNFFNNETYLREEDYYEKFNLKLMRNAIDNYLYPLVMRRKDVNFIYFYPPYSILFHRLLYEKNQVVFENELTIKRYFFEKLGNQPNVKIYDFQDLKEITFNLNNYHDLVHYSSKTSDQVVEWLSEDKERVTKDNLEKKINNLKNQVEAFNFDQIR